MLLQLHPVNPQARLIKQIVECLKDGGIIVYPTDTIYGLGCDIGQQKAVERICKIKNVDPQKAQLSFICSDLSHLSDYTKSIDTPLYRMLKQKLSSATCPSALEYLYCKSRWCARSGSEGCTLLTWSPD